jgi:hypothetical protein
MALEIPDRMVLPMRYSCPYCGQGLELNDLQQTGGFAGGRYCPKCQERITLSYPHSKLFAVVSLLLAIGILVIMHVRSIPLFAVGIVVLWIPISLALNFYSTRYRLPTLEKWKERTQKTFFEWLYERGQIRAPLPSEPAKKDSPRNP